MEIMYFSGEFFKLSENGLIFLLSQEFISYAHVPFGLVRYVSAGFDYYIFLYSTFPVSK